MRVIYHRRFKKDYRRLSDIREQVNARLDLFLENPFHPILGNHPLHGEWNGYRSINISGDYRLIYWEIDKDIIQLVALGTHEDLYR